MSRCWAVGLGVLIVCVSLSSGCDTASGKVTDPGTIIDIPSNLGDAISSADVENRPECVVNTDCSAGEVCVIEVATDGSVKRFCDQPIGTGQVGDACSTGPDCASGLCVDGACSIPCQDEADCPSAFLCAERDTGDATVQVCVPRPQPCTSPSDCVVGNTTCVVDRSGADFILLCLNPVGPGDVGTTCVQDGDCQANLCLAGECTTPCSSSLDCSTDGSFKCEQADVPTGGASARVNICERTPAGTCLSDADCSGGQRCVANRGQTELGFACQTPPGAAELGGGCSADGDCAQGLCEDGACVVPCKGSNDCSAQAGFTCTQATVVLPSNATDTAFLCLPPRVCDERDACTTTEACYVKRGASGLDTLCRPGNAGGAALGEQCTDDGDCSANLCFPDRFLSVCTEPCVDDTDCRDQPGYRCEETDVATSGGGEARHKICVGGTPPACTKQGDCSVGSCAVVANLAGSSLEQVCIPSSGRPNGTACTGDGECQSRVCLDSFCASPCVDSADCISGQLCIQNSLTRGGASGSFTVCETLQDVPCQSTRDCSAAIPEDTVRVCGEIGTLNSTLQPFCTFPLDSPPAGKIGDACASDLECREKLCLTGLTEACSVFCQADTDCPASFVCAHYLFDQSSPVELGVCVRGCNADAECQQNNLCTFNTFTENNVSTFVQVCEQPFANGKAIGEECASLNECANGLCLTTTIFNGTPCTSTANCGAGETCEPLNDGSGNSQCATVSNRCTNFCRPDNNVPNADCVDAGNPGNQLETCPGNSATIALEDGSLETLNLCTSQ